MSVRELDEAPRSGAGEGGADRRRALQLLLGGATLSAAGLLGYPVGQYLRPLEVAERDAVAALEAHELGLWDAKLLVVGAHPVIVVNTGDGYSAVSAVCTHLGCVVKWQKGRRRFFCPCHGARFDVEGNVLGGPAPEALAKLDVEESAGMVIVRRA